MMKNRLVILTIGGLFALFNPILAQNEHDALRFVSTSLTGTARSMGAGGAFSVVGADFSAASLNPAGLGLYRRSEFTISPLFTFNSTRTSYLEQSSDDFRGRFDLGQAGYVYHKSLQGDNHSGIKSVSIAIGYNQLENYNQKISANAFNAENSITELFAGQAQGLTPSQLAPGSIADLAFQAWAIDTLGGATNYVAGFEGGGVLQKVRDNSRGRLNDWSLSFALNYNDRVYIGLGVGLEALKFNRTRAYSEEDVENNHDTWQDGIPLESVIYSEELTTTGVGVNAKFGIIARPIDFLRIGASVQSPTWYSMSDNYIIELQGYLDGVSTANGLDPIEGFFDYRFLSPFKATAGAALIIGKIGFISMDVDYSDYALTRFIEAPGSGISSYDFDAENQVIQNTFRGNFGYRLGGELRLGLLRLRAGYGFTGAVLDDAALQYQEFMTGNVKKLAPGQHNFSGGFGIRAGGVYLDIAYVRSLNESREEFYAVSNPVASPALINRNTITRFTTTLGFTF